MRKVSAKGDARAALAADVKARKALTEAPKGKAMLGAATGDSFINFASKIGLGADNMLGASTYGFNPITRNRILLEWIHRGSWLGGCAIDIIADDMTRKGIELSGDIEPDDQQQIEGAMKSLGIWDGTNRAIKWARLYGGALGVLLIDGQDPRTPLRLETVGKDQFKGLLCLDRWMVSPSLEDLVTDLGPHLGMPKYYRVQDNAPALRGAAIHHSRVAFRLLGIELPYQQALTENMWGISVLERLYDRMVAFDSATMGAAQLAYKSYLRTLSIEGFRDIVAAGGQLLQGVISYTEMMRRFQSQEGITLIDSKDTFEVQQTSAMTGVGDIILQLGQQISGALQMPLVRLFGQSPAGLNSTGESDLRTYYDGIMQRQEKDLGDGIATIVKLTAQSEGLKPPDDMEVDFRTLWELDDEEKSATAKANSDTITAVKEAGIIGTQTALKELAQQSRRTGMWTNITREMIDAADDEIPPPPSEMLAMAGGDPSVLGGTGLKPPKGPAGAGKKVPGEEDGNGKTGSKRQASQVGAGSRRRAAL